VTVPNEAGAFLVSPLGLALTYVWTFLSLTAVQLTVRLIMRFDLRETAVAALWLALASVLVGLAYLHLTAGSADPAVVERLRLQGEAAGIGEQASYLYVIQQRLIWLPLALVPLVVAAGAVAHFVLKMRRRSAIVCALAMALLIAPWPALVML
jgi:hypothetical protein